MQKKGIKTGIYPDLSNEAYHADPAISASGLSAFMEVPAMYKHKVIEGNWSGNKFTEFGIMAHEFILEPDTFYDRYIVGPEKAKDKRCKEWNAFKKEISDKIPITFKEHCALLEMHKNIKEHKLADQYLSHGQAEISIFARDDDSGLMLRARPDYLVKVPDIGIVIVDYKVTGIPLNIKKQSEHGMGLNRHIQAAMHKDVFEKATGHTIADVVYITQMMEPPYLIRMFRITPEQIETGRQEYKEYLTELKYCLDNNVWPTYPEVIEDYNTPSWFDFRTKETYIDMENNNE